MRIFFFNSLIVSTLTFNAHVRALQASEIKVLNKVYMRVVRAIFESQRFSSDAHSDLFVRKSNGVDSLDCLLVRQRLGYASRLIRSRHAQLRALVAFRNSDGHPLSKWARQISDDMVLLFESSPMLAYEFVHPSVAPMQWVDAMQDETRWSKIVSDLHFTWSVCDEVAVTPSSAQNMVCGKAWVCAICVGAQPAFVSERALLSHQRVVHKCRSEMRYFAPASGVCPEYRSCFRSRLRLLAHLTARRRTRCATEIARRKLPRMAESVVQRFDLEDRAFRREAKRAGHSHAIASRPATTAAGKFVGHVRS